jgi:hypothetical protein
MGTVVEEADETLLWLELMQETQTCVSDELTSVKLESDELLRIFSSALATAKAG